MDQKEINRKYLLFEIPENLIPEYKGNPEEYARNFQKCSKMQEVNSSYAQVSSAGKKNQTARDKR